jgi:hypothetical protein
MKQDEADIGYPNWSFHKFPLYLYTNSGILLQLYHGLFLLNPPQPIM